MPPTEVVVSIAALLIVLVTMLGELMRSRANERTLRRRGAIEPASDVYAVMAWAYPLMFVAMALEGAVSGRADVRAIRDGAVIFAVGKALKYWAVTSLGTRWTYRVLVPPGESRVVVGPYRWVSHPNYWAVFLEIIGFMSAVDAPTTGVLSILGFGALMRKRVAVEEHALGIR